MSQLETMMITIMIIIIIIEMLRTSRAQSSGGALAPPHPRPLWGDSVPNPRQAPHELFRNYRGLLAAQTPPKIQESQMGLLKEEEEDSTSAGPPSVFIII